MFACVRFVRETKLVKMHGGEWKQHTDMNTHVKNVCIVRELRYFEDIVAVKFQEMCQCPHSFRKSVSQRSIVFFDSHRCLPNKP